MTPTVKGKTSKCHKYTPASQGTGGTAATCILLATITHTNPPSIIPANPPTNPLHHRACFNRLTRRSAQTHHNRPRDGRTVMINRKNIPSVYAFTAIKINPTFAGIFLVCQRAYFSPARSAKLFTF